MSCTSFVSCYTSHRTLQQVLCCCSLRKFFVIPLVGPGSVRCAGCRKLFKQLSIHFSLSPICEQLCTSTDKIDINIAPRTSARVGGLSLHDSSRVRQGDESSLPTTRTTDKSTINCKIRPTKPTFGDDLGLVNDDFADVFSGDDEVCKVDFQVLDDNASCNEAACNHVNNNGAPRSICV